MSSTETNVGRVSPQTHSSRATHHGTPIDPHSVTISGLVLDPSYGPDAPARALRSIDREIPAPGTFPYTRGLFPQGYRSRLWTMRQFAGFGSAFDTNTRFKYLLEAARTNKTKANTGLSTAFDLPTLMGRDSDDLLSAGEVGRCGVAIDTIEDMHNLYADIPLDQVTVSQTINGPAAVIWAMYLAMCKQRNFDWRNLGGTTQNDILKEFHSQNEFIYPPEPSVKIVIDTIEFAAKHTPKWHPVSISGYHIREAGSTAVQELAFTLRDGMEYVEESILRGMPVDSFAPRLSFFFNSHNEFFEEICKLRAARRIWARMMRDRYGAKSEKSWYMKTHVQTAGCSLTEQQPMNNIVRVAYQAMAAVLGGCQSLHTDSMDETLGLPTEQAVTVALRTQQILAHETGITRVADPLGGSWFIEEMTDRMEAGALELIEEIDKMGGGPFKLHPDYDASTATWKKGGSGSPNIGGREGVVSGIHKGYFRRAIAEASYRFSEECEAHDRIIVGVNEYVDPNEDRPIEILEISHKVEMDQVSRLEAFKKRRDGGLSGRDGSGGVARALDNIRAAAQNGDNVMPALIDGALANCTLGEMVQAMADVYGRYSGGPEW